MEKDENNIDRVKINNDWFKDINRIEKDYQAGKITVKEKAMQLTKAKMKYNKRVNMFYTVNQFYFFKKYPTLFSINEVYDQDIEDSFNIQLILIIDEKNKDAIDYFLKNNEIGDYEQLVKDKYYIYKFFYSIERDLVSKRHKNCKDKIKKNSISNMLDTNSSNELNMYALDFIIGLTPINKMFDSNSNYYKEILSQLNHACYILVNNGQQIHSLREIPEGDYRSSEPKFHEDLKRVFRSNWEANIARILNHMSINWGFEKESFLIKSSFNKDTKTSYIPDFFLDNNVILEVKGFWDFYSINKIFAFKEQIKDYTLKVIDTDMYFSLIKKYKEIIPNLSLEKHDYSNPPATENVTLVGIQRKERLPFIKQLEVGQQVYLKRDKENQFDKNAILIINNNEDELGFMGKEWASIYSEKMDLGMKFKAIIKSIESKKIILSVRRTNVDEDIFHKFLK